jgi:hypothetical protein
MKLKPLTAKQTDKIAELFTKMTDGKITEKEYIQKVKEYSKTQRPKQ